VIKPLVFLGAPIFDRLRWGGGQWNL